jgi:hypothetical protein
VWYLFVYDQDFTRDILLQQARYFDAAGNHSLAAILYDAAYLQSDRDEEVAIELAQLFKENGNYTKAEVTLANAIADGGSVKLYIALCQTYVEQDKLLDAVTMLDNIADPAIREQIARLRPSAPTATPEPGYYSQYIPVTIACNNGTLYVTTDGSYPSIDSGASDNSVTLPQGETNVYALTVGKDGLVSPLAIFGYTISGVIEEVTLKDSVIDAAAREALGINLEAQLYTNDLWKLTSLTLPEGVGSFADLVYMPYLETLTISSSDAKDLSKLGSLSYLAELHIEKCNLSTSDLATIASLPSLKILSLRSCGLAGINNLSAAVNLTHLDLGNNAVYDLSALSGMKNLAHLILNNNALENLDGISVLTNLETLDVSHNPLPTLEGLSACIKLKELNISNNDITALDELQALTGLSKLDASFNEISDVSVLFGLAALKELDISSNAVKDISGFSSLTLLEILKFSRNQVTTLPQWNPSPDKCNLHYIDGSYNQIKSLDVLAKLGTVNEIIMDYNKISSVNALSSCKNLYRLSVYGCPVKNVSQLTELGIIVHYNPL